MPYDENTQLRDDVVRLRFVLFSLKDLAKKWLYSLVVDSITSWMISSSSWSNSTLSTKPLSIGKTSCSASKNLVNRFGDILNVSKTLPNVLVATMPNSLWRFRLPNQDPLKNHVPRETLAKEWKPRVEFIWGSSSKNHPMGINSRKV